MQTKTLILFAGLIAFSAIFTAALFIQAAQGEEHHYTGQHNFPNNDTASRCDHLGTFNAPNDTWTGMGIIAWYDEQQSPPAYHSGNWSFERGFGGGGYPHDYTTDGDMICTYVFGSYSTTYYSSGTCSYGSGPFGNVWAWYHDVYTYKSSFDPYPHREPSFQGGSASYFKDPNNPNNRWYISSWIDASPYMTARS